MSDPGRRLPARRTSARPSSASPGRLTRAVARTGRLLCWSLAAAMATAAVDLTVAPNVRWWRELWPLPWYLTGAALLAWAVLRAREKASRQPPTAEPPTHTEWDQAA